jgi:hypothetical protein
MFQIIKHYTKLDGSEMYDVIMDMIQIAEPLKAIKSAAPGFVNLRGLISDDGLTFSVTQLWQNESNYTDVQAVAAHIDELAKYQSFISSNGVSETTETSTVAG